MRSHKHYWSDIVNPGVPHGGEEGQILIKDSEDNNDYVWSDPPSGRNSIINGNFDVWQRGTSQTSTGYDSDDRWQNLHSGSTKTSSREGFVLGQTEVPYNPTYYSRTVLTSGSGVSDFCIKDQRIEDVRTFSGRDCTLSFWAKADSAKNIAIELYQSFGTGGTPSAAVNSIGSQLIALTTSWTKYTVTITVPSITGKTVGTDGNDYFRLLFWFEGGSDYDDRTEGLGNQSGTFDISQIQLEAGTYATPFEKKTYGQEILDCQRYCIILYPSGGYGYQYAVGASSLLFNFSETYLTEMRTTPTITETVAPTYNNCTFNSFRITPTSVVMRVDALAAGAYRAYDGQYLLEAEL